MTATHKKDQQASCTNISSRPWLLPLQISRSCADIIAAMSVHSRDIYMYVCLYIYIYICAGVFVCGISDANEFIVTIGCNE